MLELVVTYKSTKNMIVGLAKNFNEVVLIEFEGKRELMEKLAHTVKVLKEHLRFVLTTWVVLALIESLNKHMPKRDPIFLDKDLKSLHCSIIGIYQNLGESTKLRCTIPSITTMHNTINTI